MASSPTTCTAASITSSRPWARRIVLVAERAIAGLRGAAGSVKL
ncbi:hypothetical protein ACFYRD_29815 [Streptomyces hirsutus]